MSCFTLKLFLFQTYLCKKNPSQTTRSIYPRYTPANRVESQLSHTNPIAGNTSFLIFRNSSYVFSPNPMPTPTPTTPPFLFVSWDYRRRHYCGRKVIQTEKISACGRPALKTTRLPPSCRGGSAASLSRPAAGGDNWSTVAIL